MIQLSTAHLRNVMTGEISDVNTATAEYREKIREIYDHNGSPKPKWEITGEHHTDRLDRGEVGEADHGYEDKPVPSGLDHTIVTKPEEHPERALTQAEVEAGITSWEEKQAQIAEAKPMKFGERLDVLDDPEERRERGESRVGSTGRQPKPRRLSATGKTEGSTPGNGS